MQYSRFYTTFHVFHQNKHEYMHIFTKEKAKKQHIQTYIKTQGNNIAVDPMLTLFVNLSSWPFLNVKIKEVCDERSEPAVDARRG